RSWAGSLGGSIVLPRSNVCKRLPDFRPPFLLPRQDGIAISTAQKPAAVRSSGLGPATGQDKAGGIVRQPKSKAVEPGAATNSHFCARQPACPRSSLQPFTTAGRGR